MNDLRRDFARFDGRFEDITGRVPPENELWPPIIVTAEQIDAEIARLAALPAPPDGRREALIVHPLAKPHAPGMAPGIEVKLSVLNPGERTTAFRHNASEVNFCIRGGGACVVQGQRVVFGQYDVWNHPGYAVYWHENDTNEVQVRLTYSNAPLLKHMQVYIRDGAPPLTPVAVEAAAHEAAPAKRTNPFGMFELKDAQGNGTGALMMPYEKLIDPPAVASRTLHWPWQQVRGELDKLEALGKDYIGRRLYMMYNPVTGRTHGCTPSFFATMTIRPPKIVDRPHRHVSAAINYYFSGSGYSVVAGNRYEWKAGDLMLSAPGWAVHNHASYDDYVYELTVQDQPLNIYMESLLWQEDMHRPAALLGTELGFATNRNIDQAAA